MLPAQPSGPTHFEPWPHESCLECELRMPSEAHANTHYAMTGHALGWPMHEDEGKWPIATDEQVAHA